MIACFKLNGRPAKGRIGFAYEWGRTLHIMVTPIDSTLKDVKWIVFDDVTGFDWTQTAIEAA